MAKLGISLPVIEKILNHVSGSFAGIVGIYQNTPTVNLKDFIDASIVGRQVLQGDLLV
jgi:hypothetical protein